MIVAETGALKSWAAMIGGAAAVLAAAASAAEPAPDAPTTVAGVVVTPRARETAPPLRTVKAFVGALSVMTAAEQLAIWSRTAIPSSPGQSALDTEGFARFPAAGMSETICPAVFGLPPAYAAFIVARLRQVGAQTGAPVGRTDCPASDANLLIVFPDDARDFIHDLAGKVPTALGFAYHAMLTRDIETPVKPIRAWYATQVVGVAAGPSRLSTQYQSLIQHVLIIVDAKQTDGLNMGQLSDYIAMTGLARIRTDSVPADASTILNVFSDSAAGRAPAEGLTRLDLAYLKALYAINPRQVGALEKDQIANRIRHDLAGR